MHFRKHKKTTSANDAGNKFTAVLFVIYLVVTGWILLFKVGVHFTYMAKRRVNLIPFNEAVILNGENILNVVIFVPIGIYTGILFERWNSGKKLLFLFLLSLIVEGLQYIFEIGIFDVTDLITNAAGGIVGLLLFTAIAKAFNNTAKTQKFFNVIAATGTIVMILLLVLLKMNMLPVRFQ